MNEYDNSEGRHRITHRKDGIWICRCGSNGVGHESQIIHKATYKKRR